MLRDKRREHGIHYTTEPLILRVLQPLVLSDLERQLASARSVSQLHTFLDRLISCTFLDPACGTGNFLVVAYRQFRRLESQALPRLLELEGGSLASRTQRVSLAQFHGIELDPASASIAQEQLARVRREEDALVPRLSPPNISPSEPRIVVANALRIDWNDVISADRVSFVLGNPPFVGMAWMTPEQQEDRRIAFSFTDTEHLRLGRLDYAASWIAKSIAYGKGHPVRFAYVVTNSMSQGEHPRSLGPIFLRHGVHLDFAWRTFPWQSTDKGRASVHVVIVGFSQVPDVPKRIFDESGDKPAKNINLYLTDGPDVFPAKRATPLRAGYPVATKGSQPTDGGHLLIDAADLEEVLADPIARKYVRRFLQATEFLWNEPRYCLWLVDATEAEIEQSPILRQRTQAVRELRERSRTRRVRELAHRPALFTQMRQPTERYLVLPEVSSARRKWIPAAFLDPEVIAGNKLITFPGADSWVFGLLQSSMFLAWVRALSGRMKSDISISPDLTYCTFPFPEANAAERERVVEAAERVLLARRTFAGQSLGELYDPRRMPKELEAAHEALDRKVDSLFVTGKVFGGDGERLEVLLGGYLDVMQRADG